MKTEVLYSPAYSLARVQLDPNEEIRVEGGAMVGMSNGVAIETKMEGGLFKSLSRSLLGGESFFVNTYKAPANGGEINLAPALPGDMSILELQNETLLVQSGAFVAAALTIKIDTSWGGAKSFFGSGGLIMLKASGSGSLILSSYGAIHPLNLGSGEKYTVDTGHLVAFTESMGFQVRRVGGMKSTLLSGEGLVVDLTGPGRALLQTRSVEALLGWLIPKLPTKSD